MKNMGEKVKVAMNRPLVEIWTLRVLMMRAQKQIRNMLLETGEGSPCYVVAESLAKVSSVIMWKAEARSDTLGDISKEVSKKSVKSAA